MGLKKANVFLFPLVTFVMVVCLSLVSVVCSQCSKIPVIFNFGDSNSDTGGFTIGLGLSYNPPYGRTYFNQPSDGRLILDFLCKSFYSTINSVQCLIRFTFVCPFISTGESLNTSYLTPYLESLDPNFTNGANFAISGASTLPAYVAFNLDIQVLQFRRFRTRSLDLIAKGNITSVSSEYDIVFVHQLPKIVLLFRVQKLVE